MYVLVAVDVKPGFVSQVRIQKDKKNSIPSAISSQQNSDKNSESKKTCHKKVSQKPVVRNRKINAHNMSGMMRSYAVILAEGL